MDMLFCSTFYKFLIFCATIYKLLIPELLYSIFALIKLFCNCYLKLSLSFYFSKNLIKYTVKHYYFSISHFFCLFCLFHYTEYSFDIYSSSLFLSSVVSFLALSSICWHLYFHTTTLFKIFLKILHRNLAC